MRLNSIKLSGFKSFAEPTNFLLPGQLVGVVERIRMHLENSNRWGLMSNEEVISLCYLLLRLLDASDADVKNALVSSLLGQNVQAENFSIGSQAMPRLLRKVLEQDLRQPPAYVDDARIAGASSEQIAFGIKEVRNALETQFVCEARGKNVRLVSSDLLTYFPKLSKIVYGENQWPFRTLNVIDEGNREGLRIEVGRSISATRVVRVMNKLIEFYGKPEAIRLDNGAELTSEAFTDWAKEHGIELRFIQRGKPNQNAFIERFNKSFRDEVLDAHLFNTLSEAQEAAENWLEDYNEYRPHESLGRLPPAIFKPRVCKPGTSTFNL